MLNPDQFQVDEAWIAFKLNDSPIRTEQDGDFDFIALMDAASCFILGSTSLSTRETELSMADSRQLLEQARSHKHQWPQTLFIARNQPAGHLSAQASREGITVVLVPEDQLLSFTAEARASFREHFAGT